MNDSLPFRDAYRVTVYYREPTYELVTGPKAEPYFWTYDIAAVSPDAARTEALRQFNEMARVSSVGWIRKVVRIDAEPAGGARLALP